MAYSGQTNNIAENLAKTRVIYSVDHDIDASTQPVIIDTVSWPGPMKTISFKINQEALSKFDYMYSILGYENRSMFIRRIIEAMIMVFETMMNIHFIDRGVPTRDVEIRIELRYGCVSVSTSIVHTSILGDRSVSGITKPRVIIDKNCDEK